MLLTEDVPAASIEAMKEQVMPQSNNALTPFDLLSSDILDALK